MEEFEFIDSDYLEVSNDFFNVQITAYVEGFDDMNFWCDVFRKYAPDLRINFSSYSRDGKLSSGKTVVLTEENIKNAGKHLILCVDSDYDFLVGDERLNNPYIFHTYTYSIENYKISPTGLESIVKKACFISTFNFDFKRFLEDYSKSIYELFLYILYFKKQGKTEKLLTVSGWETVINFSSDIDLTCQGYLWLQLLKERVHQHVSKLREKHPNITHTELQKTLEKCESETKLTINQSNLFLYIRGHDIYDSIEILLKELTNIYQTIEINKLSNQEKGNYTNKTKMDSNLKTLLNNNHTECLIYEESCPTMEKIKQDIEEFYSLRNE